MFLYIREHFFKIQKRYPSIHLNRSSMTDTTRRYKEELMTFIKLIMSSKSKETIQKEAMNHLSSDLNFFNDFLFGNMDQTHTNSDLPNHSMANTNQSVDLGKQREETTSFENKTLPFGKMNESVVKEVNDAPRKRRRSKYDNVDFSQIYREPKSSKYTKLTHHGHVTDNRTLTAKIERQSIDSSKNDLTMTDNSELIHSLFQMISETKPAEGECNEIDINSSILCLPNTCVGQVREKPKDEPLTDSQFCIGEEECRDSSNASFSSSLMEDSKTITISSLVSSLINPKCKEQQDEVLEILRSNESIRRSVLKEVSGFRGIRIPIFSKSPASSFQDIASNKRCDESSTGNMSNMNHTDELMSREPQTSAAGDMKQSLQHETLSGNSASYSVFKEIKQMPLDTDQENTYPSLIWLPDKVSVSCGPLAGTSTTVIDNNCQNSTNDTNDNESNILFSEISSTNNESFNDLEIPFHSI